jgi:hypothetical protein
VSQPVALFIGSDALSYYVRGLWVTNGTAAGTHELVSSLFGGVEALGVRSSRC